MRTLLYAALAFGAFKMFSGNSTTSTGTPGGAGPPPPTPPPQGGAAGATTGEQVGINFLNQAINLSAQAIANARYGGSGVVNSASPGFYAPPPPAYQEPTASSASEWQDPWADATGKIGGNE